MPDRLDRLRAHIDRASGEPWSWPLSNCLTFLGDWVEAERPGYSFGRWRGACPDEPAFRRIYRKAGGGDALVSREAKRAGLSEIALADAEPGDVGMIRIRKDPVKPGHLNLGCILSPTRRWAIRTNTGVVLLHEEHGLLPHLVWKV